MLRLSGRVTLWVMVLLLGCMAGLAGAQAFPRILEDIKVYSAKELEVVQFQFSQPYEGLPGQEHRNGVLALNFLSVGSKEPVRSFRVGDSRVLQEIRIVQNRYSTTVTLTLRDADTTLKNRIAFTPDGNRLRMAIQPQAATTANGGATSDAELLRQMEQVIAGREARMTAEPAPAAGDAAAVTGNGDAPAPLGGFQGVSWLPTMATMLLALAIITGLLYGVVFIYNRLLGRRFSGDGGGYAIRLLASHHIGPKHRIVVVDINGEQLACGVTPTQITLLGRLGGGAARGRAPARPRGTAPGGGDAPSGGTSPAPAEPGAGQADAVQQFADVLKRKVRSLKQIK